LDATSNKQLNTALRRYDELWQTFDLAIDEETSDTLLVMVDEQGAEIDQIMQQANEQQESEKVMS
jgi:hypothetical protein